LDEAAVAARIDMITLAPGVSYTDVHFIGLPGIIASVVLHGPGGAAIIDPGPTSTLPALVAGLSRAGIAMADVSALLLTHIHLDHAGATGTLVRQQPELRVYVHEKGAPHLVDPTRLLASATRLYGDAMDRLWGDVLPVPAHALTVLAGGERISAGGRDLDIAYTPGHASHHVSYFSADTGIAFVGDTAGVRLTPGGFNVRRRRRPTSISSSGARASSGSTPGDPTRCSSHTSGPTGRLRPISVN
jgi:glyoxylase-like metal-dependent hydrolase (beta-lactamase superfamily II)